MHDRPDFDEFVATRSTRLLRTAYLLTRDWALAEDLLQTALMKAWFAWRRVQGEPEAYVRKIIATTYVSWLRRRWTGEVSRSSLPEASVVDGTIMLELRHDLWSALGELPPRQRAVLVLRYFEDMTEAQAAEVLDVSVGTVKSQAAKALTRLREITTSATATS